MLGSAPVPDGTQQIISLLQAARTRGHNSPVLSPQDTLLQGPNPALDFKAVQHAGFSVVVWTVNDPHRMAELLASRVDGIISDRPDLLRRQVQELAKPGDNYFTRFDVEGHRGGRDLRPENTLPAFESGLDNLITTIETDTGVTSDGISLISHEQFINPQTCRTVDGTPYDPDKKVWIKDLSMGQAARRFVCDKLFRGPQQQNGLALSPVSVAFARGHAMLSPYSPTYVAQLFDFVRFYVAYYRSGAGRAMPQARERASNAEKVRFNLETKLTLESEQQGHTPGPDRFAETLGGVITAHNMQSRSDVQSFDFRTLAIIEKRFPTIRTVYLLESMASLNQ